MRVTSWPHQSLLRREAVNVKWVEEVLSQLLGRWDMTDSLTGSCCVCVCVHSCFQGHYPSFSNLPYKLFCTEAGGTWSRDRAGANEDTYLLLVKSTGDVLSTYLQTFKFSNCCSTILLLGLCTFL